ncbi:bacterio-opsin activator domain-containing protein [Halodesulfurarchaeum formicicum]|uniref:bacterio-opsin activator domain-containing protein n=1 Tax=Halodesulfurarchaeum formicicum TaxID=1873524 RepID=UPI000878D80C|nr:bacterio-opsin activator domain-containing protein [Halodesulfurarchaeum formicicum]
MEGDPSRGQWSASRDGPVHVLVVDGETEFVTTVAAGLTDEAAAVEVTTATGAQAALSVLEANRIDAVVSGDRMPETEPLEFFRQVEAEQPGLPFIIFTDRDDEQVASEALSAGVTDYLYKTGPQPIARLATRLQNAVARIRAERDLEVARRDNRERFERSPVGRWIEDFSAVRRAVEQLQAEGVEDIEAYLESHPEKTAALARSVEVVSVNEAVLEMYGAESVTDFKQGLGEIFGPESMAPFREVVGAIAAGERSFRTEKTDRRLDGEPVSIILHWSVTSGDDAYERVRVSTIDISARESRERRLKKRERLFRDLYRSSQRCLSANSETEVFDHVAKSTLASLSLLEVSIFAFDAVSGRLEATASAGRVAGQRRPVSPGEGPIWEIFRTGETRHLEWAETDETKAVGVPIGDFGVLLARSTTLEPVDIEMIELCVSTADAVLTRIQREGERDALAEDLNGQQTHVEKVRGLLDATQSILQDVPESTRGDMEDRVVSELVTTDTVDFAWIGRPVRTDGELDPTAWAGMGAGYLDAIDPTDGTDPSPAQLAGRRRSQTVIDRIPEQVGSGTWAKEALSLGYGSVLAEPLLSDEVLYGVLTVYATEPDGFGSDCRELISDVGSLLTTVYAIQNARSSDVGTRGVELEFSIGDSTDPVTAVAARTGVMLQFDTVLETTNTGARILVTVDSGHEGLPEEALEVTAITDAAWFGGPAHEQLVLEIEGPMLATGVRKHGGRLVSAITEPDRSVIVVSLSGDRPARPLIEWLQQTYPDIELLARRETDVTHDPAGHHLENILTDRQLEILTAAYYGGYFASPRTITGQELGESFDISDSAVHKHIRSSLRTLLEQLLVSASDN